MNDNKFSKIAQVQNEVLVKYSSSIVKRGLLLAQSIEASYAQALPLLSNSANFKEDKNSEILFLQGMTLYKQGNVEQAIPFLDKVLEVEPNHIDALCFRGFAFDSLGQTQKGFRDLAEVINLNPTDRYIHILYAQGVAHLLMSDQATAQQRFVEILKAQVRPSHIFTTWDLYFRACTQCLFLSNKPFALQNCEQGSLADPDNLLNLALQGLILCELGNYEKAIQVLTKVITANPDHIKADITLYSRGLAYYQLRDFKKAIEDFTYSLALNPNNAKSYLYRGLTYIATGNFIRAAQDVGKGLAIDPNLYNTDIKSLDASFANTVENKRIISNLFVNTGDFHHESENYQYAIEDYSYAIDLDPDNVEANISRDLVLIELDGSKDVEVVTDPLPLKNYQSDFLLFVYSMAQFSRTVERIAKLDSEVAAEIRESFLNGFNAVSM